ncbi:MAG: hypothetical protein J6T59_02940 [Bacteroidales bacterium]|nr:hypothetical protein [Bacteroidales bacterium]
MKKCALAVLPLLCLLVLMTNSCKQKETSQPEQSVVELNEQTVRTFADMLVGSLNQGNAAALNDIIDKDHIKTLVSENSIVYSGFDVEGGQAYFDHCLQLGDQVEQALEDGGDFSFTRYYLDEDGHHAVFRTYHNYIVDFYDCQLDTMDDKIVIKDCYMYSLGTNLSENVKYNMLYNLLLQTNPESEVQWLREAEELTANGRHKDAISSLKAHEEELKDYPLFYQLYIVNLYQDNPKTFLGRLDALKDKVDPRYLLFHQLHGCYNGGDVSGTERIVEQMIAYTGDDPIYLFLLGQAYQNKNQYDKAAECYKILDESMPLFWDLWQSELLCYKKMKDQTAYDECLRRGEEVFGPLDE